MSFVWLLLICIMSLRARIRALRIRVRQVRYLLQVQDLRGH